jgi:hypothetical protein
MATHTTTKYALRYPDLPQSPADIPDWLGKLAADTDAAFAGYGVGVFSSRPSAGKAGFLYLASDTGVVYMDDGAAWHTVGFVADGGVTVAKLDVRIPNPNFILGLMMIEGVLPYNGYTTGTPQTSLEVAAVSSWDLSINAGRALVQGDDDATQGMYLYTRAATGNITLGTHAPASNPRWDIIGLQYNDADFTGRSPVGANLIQVVGTPNSSASMTGPNLAGLPSLPNSCLPLAYILIKNTDSGVVGGQIISERKLAGPGIWGEDNHRYRLGVQSDGTLGIELVI